MKSILVNQPTSQPINQPTSQPINQPPINQPPINQSTNQPVNQSTNQPANQPTSQPINQPTNQPINQPTGLRNRALYFVVALALIALFATLYWYNTVDGRRFDWRDSWVESAYSETSDQPYGTQVLHRLLDDYFPAKKFADIRENIVEELPLDSAKRSSYVFVGEGLFLDSLSTAHLLAFVGRGNTALLSSKTVPFDLMFHLYFEECAEAEWNDYAKHSDTLVHAGLSAPWFDKPVSLHFADQNIPEDYAWSYIEPEFFCDELPQYPLGRLNDSFVNFAVFPYGDGRFLLHTTPIAFSNYHLLRKPTRRYAEGILAHLPEGDIYWDAYSRVPEAVARRRNNDGGRALPTEHPLAYVLQKPPLAWVWYLLMALALAYLVFRAKRRQRIIPVLGKNENSSYEFISTIANLHFREKNYRYLCVQTMRLFLAHVRERYGLVAQLDPDTLKPRFDAQFEQRLAQVSGVPLRQVHDIFTQYVATVQYEPTEDMMVRLHQAVEVFWKRSAGAMTDR
ncbi:MAG: PT domain-containing protein [Saprospiraceae bacterium]|nr:PT domain-containing protein [Saprospiraceae bacterium]